VISLQSVGARVGDFRLVDINIDVPCGAYGVVIGPAGSGKTTLLETIAGVIRPTSGRILVSGTDVTTEPPEHRALGIVYQHAYLFPHLTVRQNVEYGALTVRIAADVCEKFDIGALAGRSVSSLSGGERQLVALARALARQPDVLLLDEPFSALDPRTRDRTRRLLQSIYHERRFTVLQVTHDFSEAGTLGDIAIVMDAGRVLQQGIPAEVFGKPASPYIADFLGAENVFAGTVRAFDPDAVAVSSGLDSSLAGRAVAFTTGALTFYAVGDTQTGPAHAVIRAEEVALSASHSTFAESSVQNQFPGRIVEILNNSPLARIAVDASGTTIVATVTARSVRELGLAVGSDVVASFKATAVHLC
jgi:molybdate/tungstate transport system ATP-binding protein